uniref:Uncharacterized protein n=1 Tax=Romanomermis culicivorax TaxID=13658 RepID=A0A915IB97_ROMCU
MLQVEFPSPRIYIWSNQHEGLISTFYLVTVLDPRCKGKMFKNVSTIIDVKVELEKKSSCNGAARPGGLIEQPFEDGRILGTKRLASNDSAFGSYSKFLLHISVSQQQK